ncbi:MAG: hypothetical protein HZB65_01350 [Candidatus Aenigmarchaeota archaeon]|nr:hypothetical protein [Candidatus Aenigmarchaeota archaeon]
MQKLCDIKTCLLKNGLYAETVDKYYDIDKKGGLTPLSILETCCINHQLIIFIDGEGKGTLTEQNYLADNYLFHGKILYFIEREKFDSLRNNPCSYIKDFPTIIVYKECDSINNVLVFSRFRMYRLAEIIQKQACKGKGLQNPNYKPWASRLLNRIPRK